MKKAKTTVLREPSSTGGDQSGVANPKKAKMPSGMLTESGDPPKVVNSEATKVSSSEVIPAKPLQSVPPKEKMTRKDKGKAHQAVETEKEKENFLTMNFQLPSDFLLDGEMDRGKIFPDLEKFLLPTFREKYEDVSVDETGAHAAGLSFMALQANLNLYKRMDEIRTAIPRAVEKSSRQKLNCSGLGKRARRTRPKSRNSPYDLTMPRVV